MRKASSLRVGAVIAFGHALDLPKSVLRGLSDTLHDFHSTCCIGDNGVDRKNVISQPAAATFQRIVRRECAFGEGVNASREVASKQLIGGVVGRQVIGIEGRGLFNPSFADSPIERLDRRPVFGASGVVLKTAYEQVMDGLGERNGLPLTDGRCPLRYAEKIASAWSLAALIRRLAKAASDVRSENLMTCPGVIVS